MKIKAISILLVIFLASSLLFYFNPEEELLAPKCIFKMLTGLDCPSCGCQRAIHHLLHGDLCIAISYNPFLVYTVPYFLMVVMATYLKTRWAQRLRYYVFNHRALMLYVALYFLWWIVRNIKYFV